MENEGMFVLLGTIVVLGAIWAGLIAPLKRRFAWKTFAAQAGLTYKHTWFPGVTRLSGHYQGRQFEAETFCVGDKYGSSTTHVALALQTAREMPGLTIRPYRSQIIKMHFANKEDYRQDEDFNQRFHLACRSEQFAIRLFASLDLRRQLYQTLLPKVKLGTPAEIRIDSQQIMFKQRACYALRSSAELGAIMDLLIALADSVEMQ